MASTFSVPNVVIYLFVLQDRIIARLQQPYSLDCIPVEAEYQVLTYKICISHGFTCSPFSLTHL